MVHRQVEELRSVTIEDELSPYFIRESIRQLEEGIGAINTATTKIEELLREYAIELAELENASQKDQDDFEEYSSKAEMALTSAFDYILLLQARLRAFKSCEDQMILSASRTTLGENIPNGGSPTTEFELPTLPIPTFRGIIWDWANFSELFNANVHSQPLPDLYKFNYLLNALKGEAYKSVKKFQVTPDNYMKAIDFLRNKYENTEELVTRLIDRLENCQLRSPLLKDQRSLLEQIQVVIMQLIRQGEQFLEEIISGEEMISLYMKKTSTSCSTEHTNKQVKEQHKFQSTNCMYCGKSHKSFECDRYKTPHERSKYLRGHKLCLICASPQHITSQCKKRLCFKCQGAHHTSCCFKYNSQVRPSSPPTEPSNQVHQAKRSGLKNNQIKDSRTIKSPRKVNQLCTERPSGGETAILELQSAHGVKQAQDTFLPTGEMTVLDPRSKTLRKIPVLLDTGAEVSFIDTTLADELNLPTLEKTKLRLHTFGSDQVQESNCRRVPLEVWDSEGKPFSLNLITHEILTKSFATPPIKDEDIDFIKCKNLPIQLNRNMATVKRLVLLCCDQLWSLIRDDQPHIQLPSGLYLLPTRLGHLLTGQLNQLPQVKDEAQLNEKDTWNGYWTLEAQVHIVTTSPQTENSSHERELWEKFWALEAAGTEVFSNSEREEQALVDKQVWDNFKRTVEKREDGYYVRIPWKYITTKLPDNRAIAYRRLISVWNSLQKNDELLNKYHEVFQEQLRLNILEQEFNMNLREFVSNDPETSKSIPEKDRSSEHVPKVLGIKWDSTTDCIEMSCSLENNPSVTKRIVASAIASIYDPLGWLVPLLHKAKVFLRLLWKENFDWDTKVPQERENEWIRICEEIKGFRKIIPPFLSCKQASPIIITFADASAEAIASCVYLRSSYSVNLMMAKGKLPTLKSATTMPKMELNAATLAMRLTISVVSQLQSVLTPKLSWAGYERNH
ncbi:Pao retrotransposon peptidase [Ancylostoma ceylanicum]|uniref:Pao retrotransposon peptidase n=1 Tax=Ancylostoma ceylanicum TaxID=53326 RepID=A0A0D6L725_9BILA|nr:Pao retrotransposon peptidase [Ancylostoma ceylanicum]